MISEIPNNKAVRLIDYLTRLTSLRSNIIYNIDDYQSVLWLSDIPQLKGCFTHAWGPNSDVDIDIWLEVSKETEPTLVDIPEECEEWITVAELYNDTKIPPLKESIVVTETLYDEENEEDHIEIENTKYLNDCPEVQQAWEHYINTIWMPWSEKHKQWRSIFNVYSKLFTMYQEQLKLGEEYELVLGLGLLTWKPSGQVPLKRHLITVKASLHFEVQLGRFWVGPDEVGGDLSIEADLLDVLNIPLNMINSIIEELNQSEGNPWDTSTINTVLYSLSNTISKEGSGEYCNQTLEHYDSSDPHKMRILYAPALILRKRSMRGLQDILSKIRKYIVEGGYLPNEFADLAESKSTKDSSNNSVETDIITNSQTSLPSDIYFPDKSNEEQLSIVHRMNRYTGVIVQGPPGTGKSHTIANLIAHLLATGNRVLVTAKTPRALKVLHDKIHEDIKPLCINFIGDTIHEKISLEHSVKSILSEQYTWNALLKQEELKKLENTLNVLRKNKAEIEHRIRSIREKDTLTHSLLHGSYVGTASSIAKTLKLELKLYDWFIDNIQYEMEYALDVQDVKKILEYRKELAEDEYGQYKYCIPVIGKDIPDINTFRELILHEKEYDKYINEHINNTETTEWVLIEKTDTALIQDLSDKLNALREHVENIRRRPMPWIPDAIADMLADNDTPWKELLSLTSQTLVGLRDKARSISKMTCDIPNEYDINKLIEDTKDLIQHLKNGHKFKRLLFKPRIVKEKGYIFNICVDGSHANTEDKLTKLLSILEVRKDIEYLWNMWIGRAKRSMSPLLLQVTELEELNEALKKVIDIYDLLEASKLSVAKIRGLTEPKWHLITDIDRLLITCKLYLSKHKKECIQKTLGGWVSALRTLCQHDNSCIVLDIISHINQRDINQYTKCIQILGRLHEMREKRIWMDNAINKYKFTVPCLINSITSDPQYSIWNERILGLEKAWNWKRVSNWLDTYINEDNIEALESNLVYNEKEIRRTIASIAKIKAWDFCFKRMSESHRRHLMGWQQAITRLGKGTGKHAPKHRRDAQGNLKKCHDAIPAWIMPLHRVYDTVDAIPELFDVIIVDEASQCGYEALPLTFLSKKILVVGDNQQISPEAVGIDQETAYRLRQDYLKDYEHADAFDFTASLFDHCNRRFGGGTIVLREHFRCMPEIIRFSNDLSYAKTPLIPLRQYPSKRLTPLKSVHVTGGYKEGKSSNAINRPEAEAIVTQISELCKDSRYTDKSMGVIVLTGDSQAHLIEKMLLEEIGSEEYQKRNIICGNPYSFQGDERDIIFMSMVVSAGDRIGVLSKEYDRRRFNVAASRARDQMWLFHSVSPDLLSTNCFRRILLDYFLKPQSTITASLGDDAELLRYKAHTANRMIEKPPSPYDSWFELDVSLDIASQGFKVIPQYHFAGKRIDLVIEGQESKLAVECYGDYWHGIDDYEHDIQRKRQLERCGWTFHIIRECEYNSNPSRCIEQLINKCSIMGIMPIDKSRYICNHTNEHNLEENKVETDISCAGAMFMDTEDDNIVPNIVKPNNINDAMGLKPIYIKNMIVNILKDRPNQSCMLDKLPSYILKEWDIISRGQPREKFCAKVSRIVKEMNKQNRIIIYKSKNLRVKLLK